jgi:thiol-disulfide isomerase/thioredoxin
MKKVILVTTKTCPFCPLAKILWKELQKDYKFEFEEVDAMSPEGEKLVEEFGIASVPTTIIEEENGRREIAFIGVPSKEEAIRKIKGE